MFKCYFYFFLCDFLHSSGEHIFGSIATVFVSNDVQVGIDFLGGLDYKIKNFPLLNPKNMNF